MKILFIFIILALFLANLSSVHAQCINPTDNYAAEVVLNKPGIDYKLDSLNNAKNVLVKGSEYILQSDYSPELAVVLSRASDLTTGLSTGLSIKIQMPLKAEQKSLPYLKFISSSARGKINSTIENEDIYNGWKISCIRGDPIPQCEFTEEKTKILASLVSSSKYEIEIETNQDLKECKDCQGRCVKSKCIDGKLESDIEDILKHSGLISSFDELFSSYRVISSGNTNTLVLTPETNAVVDWQEAMRQELVRLRRENIILITNSEIEDIARLSRQGAAGQNSRIVYGEDTEGNERWLYYYQTKFPMLTKLENCQEFPISLFPTGALTFSGQEISNYYLIPLVLGVVLIILFLILIAVARAIEIRKRKHKIKPVTSLQSS